MKAFSKILMLALILGLLVGTVFAIGAFAQEKATNVTYVVPEGNTDTFLLFDAKTGEFIRSANNLMADGPCMKDGVNLNENVLDRNEYTDNASKSYYVLMQKDYELTNMWKIENGTYSKTAGLNNLFNYDAEYVIDLGGNTMTISTTMNAVGKGTEKADLKFTFKNGTILNNSHLFSFNTYNKDRSAHITFDHITFAVASGKKPTYWVSSNGSKDYEKTLEVYITYKNCTFDTTNLAQKIYVNALGSTYKNLFNHPEYIDCTLKGGKENYFYPTYSIDAEGSSVTFTAIAEDSTTTPYGIIPEQYASVEDYPFVMFDLSTHTLIWKGAQWGGEDVTGSVPNGLMYAIYKNSAKATATYLRRDFTVASKATTQFYNQGNTYGTHIIDLGNHTVTAAYDASLLHEQIKGNTKDMFLTIKNGTFDLKNTAQLLYITGTDYCHNKGEESEYMYDSTTHKFTKKSDISEENMSKYTPVYYYTSNCQKTMTYLFENIEVKNLGSDRCLVRESASNTTPITADITFKNCDIEYSVNRTNPLFYYGQTKDSTSVGFYKGNGAFSTTYKEADKAADSYVNPAAIKKGVDYTINVTLEGGSIANLYNTTLPTLASTPKYHIDQKSTTLVASESGAYTSIAVKAGTSTSGIMTDGIAYATDTGSSFFMLDETNDNESIYRIGIMHKSGYGFVPPSIAENESDYPILVFNATDKYLETTKLYTGGTSGTWGNVDDDPNGALKYVKDNGTKNKSYVIYLTKNMQSKHYNNLGSTAGTHVIDLGGHTLTMAGTLFHAQAKSKDALQYTIKNGTISVGKQKIVDVGSLSSGGSTNKESTFIFENVKFAKINDTATLVSDSVGGADVTTTNVNFINCTFELASDCKGNIFCFGIKDPENATVKVTIEGGGVHWNSTTLSVLSNDGLYDNKSVQFIAKDGKYTAFTSVVGADASAASIATDKDTFYLRQVDTSNGIATYALSKYGFISSYLNLANDLNMVYRVFLPANADATVTFVIDGFEKTVEAFGTDENGLFLFKLAGITPAKMNEDITATLTAGELTATNHYTIKAYLDQVLAEYGEDETYAKMITLVNSLLVYGAAAQQYANGNTEGFDAATLDQLANLEAIPTSAYDVEKGEAIGVEYFAMNLRGTIYLRVGIVVEDATGVTLEATKGGKTTVYNVASYTAEGGMIAITYDAFTATELDKVVTFTLKAADGTVIDTLSFSANAYLYSASNSTIENLAPLAKALYAYGVAAKAYVA